MELCHNPDTSADCRQLHSNVLKESSYVSAFEYVNTMNNQLSLPVLFHPKYIIIVVGVPSEATSRNWRAQLFQCRRILEVRSIRICFFS